MKYDILCSESIDELIKQVNKKNTKRLGNPRRNKRFSSGRALQGILSSDNKKVIFEEIF